MHKFPLNGLKLWLGWILANFIGLIVGGVILYLLPTTYPPYDPENNALNFMTTVLGFFLLGFVLGRFQSLIIGPKINGWGKWVWVTAIGLGVWGCFTSLSTLPIPAKPFLYTWIVEKIDSLAPFLIGLAIGVPQWLVLRRQVNKAGWWMVAYTLGWFIPIGLSRILEPSDAALVTIILIAMIFPSALTGFVLLYFFEGTNIFSKPIAVYHEASKKKRYLFIFATLVILLFSLFTAKVEFDSAYAACSKEMSTREGFGPWEYQETSLSLPEIVFVYNDGCNEAICYAGRNNAGWYVSDVWETLVGCFL